MKILMVMAHPDDEVIFGWPILQSGQHRVFLLTLSHNRAKYGPGPVQALQEVAAATGARLLDIPREETNFYRLPPRGSGLLLPIVIRRFQSILTTAIDQLQPEVIFTHNPMGEYGHGDHRFVFHLVSMLSRPLLFTDICQWNLCHLGSTKIPTIWQRTLYDPLAGTSCMLDLDWYQRMQAIYQKYRSWSWSSEVVSQCRLYQVL